MTNLETLCQGFPTEFLTYMQYCRTLEFDNKPDYRYIIDLFSNLFKSLGYEYDYQYDWVVLEANGGKKQ